MTSKDGFHDKRSWAIEVRQ